MRRITGSLTYANVVSTLCLVLLLGGGTAIAASKMLPKDSVGSAQLKPDSVTASKIRSGAIEGSKIAPGSIQGSDIDLGSLGTVPSATAATHAVSAEHAAAADHATSADTASSAVTATSANSLEGKTAAQIVAESRPSCPAGTKMAAGLCFETSVGGEDTQQLALLDCAVKGRWLPTISELEAYESANYVTAEPKEWTDSLFEANSQEEAYLVIAEGASAYVERAAGSTIHPYRCVSAPTD